MKHQNISTFMLYVLSVVIAVSAVTEDDIYRVFTENNITYDSKLVHMGMIEGMLRTVDTRARLLNSNDIARLNSLSVIESSEKLGATIGYLKINGLYSQSGDIICKELKSYASQDVAGQILDLRGADGDDLDSVNSIINLFVASTSSLYQVIDNSGGVIGEYNSPSNNVVQDYEPLMVLVDNDTHDASEVLAAVLKGRAGVMLIGSTTQGHRGLMELVPFSGSESLYIVTKHILPVGAQGSFTNGVSPDVAVAQGEEAEQELPLSGKVLIGKDISQKAKADRKIMERVVSDAALRRATDILLGLQAVNSEQ